MSLLKIKNGASPILRATAQPITEITDDIRQLAKDMRMTMFRARGCGLAAPQVGRSLRMVVVCRTPTDAVVLINPSYTPVGDNTAACAEGCLSLPGKQVSVRRYKTIAVQAMDEQGDPISFQADGMLARIIQHEVDHLDGRLITDYLTPPRAA